MSNNLYWLLWIYGTFTFIITFIVWYFFKEEKKLNNKLEKELKDLK